MQYLEPQAIIQPNGPAQPRLKSEGECPAPHPAGSHETVEADIAPTVVVM